MTKLPDDDGDESGDEMSAITDEFFRRLDAGEDPDIEQYAARYPDLADKLRTLLPLFKGARDAPPPGAPIGVSPGRGTPGRGTPAADERPALDVDSSPAPRKRLRYVVGAAIVAAIAVPYVIPNSCGSPVPPPPPPPSPRFYIDNSGTRFVYIPAGRFEMGATDLEIRAAVHAAGKEDREAELRSELPRRTVEITRPFHLGMYEVTVKEFREFVTATRYVTQAERDQRGLGWNQELGAAEEGGKYTWENPGFAQGEGHPVVLVAWVDAVEFCRWKTEREKVPYRLPTEAEWEYVRLDGTPPVIDEETKYANVADLTLRQKYPTRKIEPVNDQHVFTAPVGSFEPNAHRIRDLTGNVFEWCSDWHSRDYQGAAAVDPVGPVNGTKRVARGGSWNRMGVDLRVTSRAGATPPSNGNSETGFRLVREIP